MAKCKFVKGSRGRVKNKRYLDEPAFEKQPKRIPKKFDGIAMYEPTTGESVAERGLESERMVKEMLQHFKEQSIIKDYRKTKKQSRLDNEGIDFFVFYRGNRIRLQVKSSDHGSTRFAEKTYSKHTIFVINGRSSHLYRDIMRILERHRQV